jgi:hypothetical protein
MLKDKVNVNNLHMAGETEGKYSMGDFEHFPRRAFLGIYERLNKM